MSDHEHEHDEERDQEPAQAPIFGAELAFPFTFDEPAPIIGDQCIIPFTVGDSGQQEQEEQEG